MSKQIVTTVGDPRRLGVNRTEDGYNFAVVACDATITLNLYEKDAKEPSCAILLDGRYKFGDIFAVRVSGLDWTNMNYNYTIGEKKVLDPYAAQVCDAYAFGESIRPDDYRSKVMVGGFDWEDDQPLHIPYEDSIIYKLHVRGFTKHASSKVKAKGTYAGVIEKIPYLQELGITTVEMMPVFEFEEVQKWTGNDKNSLYNPQFNGKVNYWGFAKGMYFAPKSAYSVGGRRNQDYTLEFKQMVKELHKAGIEVIIEMFFPYDAGINLIRDCVRYWVVEYHIDGVHMNASNAAMEAIAGDPLLSHVKMFSTYWDGITKNPSYKNLANYNQGFMDCARKLLKGDENQLNEFSSRVKANDLRFGQINYIANSNGFTLMDLVSYDRKHNEPNGENNHDGEDFNNSWNCGIEGKCRKKKTMDLRLKQIKNALMMVFLSQGTPLLLAGDEFGNSQNGNNNPYCQDNEVSWLNWKNLDSNKEIFEFTKELIAFRKKHRILHMDTPLRDMDYRSCGYPDVSFHSDNAWFASFENYNRHFGMMYCGKYATNADGSEDDFIYVAYNLHWEKHVLALPTLQEGYEWEIVMDSTGKIDSSRLHVEERGIEVEERSIVVLTSTKK